MKRTFICFTLIMIFVVSVVAADIIIITDFSSGMTQRLDEISVSESFEEQKVMAKDLDSFFQSRRFWIHRLVPTGKAEDVETLLHKLNAYLKEDDKNEVEATVAELRARVNFLYSTWFYHWHHPFEFRIE